jgi:hypothetical protein
MKSPAMRADIERALRESGHAAACPSLAGPMRFWGILPTPTAGIAFSGGWRRRAHHRHRMPISSAQRYANR